MHIIVHTVHVYIMISDKKYNEIKEERHKQLAADSNVFSTELFLFFLTVLKKTIHLYRQLTLYLTSETIWANSLFVKKELLLSVLIKLSTGVSSEN